MTCDHCPLSKILIRDLVLLSDLLFDKEIAIRKGRDSGELTLGESMECDRLLQMRAKIDEMLN